MHQNGHHAMTKPSVLNLSVVYGHLKRVRTSHEGVVVLHMRYTIAHYYIGVMNLNYELSSCATWWLLHKLGSRWVNEQVSEIQNTLLYHDLMTILVHFGAFWCILVNSMHNPMTPPLITMTKFKILCSVMVQWPFCAFWCILMHFGAPNVWPHDSSMTCSDCYPILSVHLLQQWIT